MRFSSVRYLIKQGWKNMGANRLMTFASIGVLTACFIITGVAMLVWVNVDKIADYMADQNEIVAIMVGDIETDEQAAVVGQAIEALPNVDHVEYMSKADAFEDFVGMMEGYSALFDGYENILPARYLVTVKNLETIEQTNAQLMAIDGIETTYVQGDLASVLVTIKNGVTWGGAIIVALLAAVSIVVIVNTIRLTVFARRKEISIMKYVGATNAFIRLPFFVEGMTVGLIAGLLSSGAICLAYYFIMDFLQSMYNVWVLGLMSSLLPLETVWPTVVLAAVVGGMVLGGFGSALSVRKHLKV